MTKRTWGGKRMVRKPNQGRKAHSPPKASQNVYGVVEKVVGLPNVMPPTTLWLSAGRSMNTRTVKASGP